MKNQELKPIVTSGESVSIRTAVGEEITAIIKSNDPPKAIMNHLEKYHGSDIADVIGTLTTQERRKFYRVCSLETLAEVFEHTGEEEAGEYLGEMDIRKAAEVVSELDTDTAVKILSKTEKEKRDLIIDTVEPGVRGELKLIASFDEEKIGSRMTTNCIILKDTMSIKQAMSALISQARKNDNVSTLFAVDENNVFNGAIDLKDLITAGSEEELKSLIATSFPYVYATEQIPECIEKLKDYSEYIIPVLDNSNKLLGVITAQNIIEASDEEMSDDYAKLGGLTSDEDLNEPVSHSIKKRLPWLLILLGLGMVVSTVVGVFEKVIAQLTLIIAFQSLILDMAGNVGTQSLAVTIRVLTGDKLTFKQKLHLVTKEIRISLANGTLIGILAFVFVGLYILLFKGKEPLFSFAMSGCIGLSLLIAIIVSGAIGTLVPLFFKKIKIDPAVASGPMITTLNDLVAVVVYYGTSRILLLNILGLG